jgi:glycosyltransferase involved in cell wall biosynthesis
MAAQLPVVATRVGGVPEVVLEGQTGLLASAGDDAALADCLLRLANQPELRRQFGQAGRQRAEALFCQRLMHQQYADCFEEMLG